MRVGRWELSLNELRVTSAGGMGVRGQVFTGHGETSGRVAAYLACTKPYGRRCRKPSWRLNSTYLQDGRGERV